MLKHDMRIQKVPSTLIKNSGRAVTETERRKLVVFHFWDSVSGILV